MTDQEHDIPVKVVDRRWWARGADAAPDDARESSKPSYVAQLEEQLAEKDRQLQEAIGKYRQANAEFEESRLRLRREISKDIERVRRELISELLEVLDNLDRAIDSARQPAAQPDGLIKGIEMVQRQFLTKLDGLGVKRIEVGSGPFDPAVHEAVTTVPAASPDQDGAIVGIIRHGYKIGQDVLRPAAVAVAKT
jgi:molecular chaperone GrpE